MMLQTYSKIPLYRASARVADPGRAHDGGRQPQRERSDVLAGLGAVLQHAVQHPAQPRPGQARRAAAEAAEPPALQRQRAAEPRAAERWCARRGRRSARPCAACSRVERPRRRREKPAADESALESSLISQFLGGVEIVPEKSTRLVEIVYVSSESGVRRAGRDDARRRVRAAEHRPASRDDQQEPRCGWPTRSPSRRRRSPKRKTAMSQLPRAAERALARGSPEHRRRALEHAERHGDARAHDAPAEGSQLQPGEVGRSEERRGRRLSRSSRPTRG